MEKNQKSENMKIQSFPPNFSPDAKKLILGSMPGGESLRQQQYYAHPRNKFWEIMGEILNFDFQIPYIERLKILRENKIALWDVAQTCVRPGSLDSNIKEETPNDFESFFKKCPEVTMIVFNGQTAKKLFTKHTRNMKIPELELRQAPSTSPANASVSYEQKLLEWKRALIKESP
jgi:TDG/mug DNA glycosylase family protein